MVGINSVSQLWLSHYYSMLSPGLHNLSNLLMLQEVLTLYGNDTIVSPAVSNTSIIYETYVEAKY